MKALLLAVCTSRLDGRVKRLVNGSLDSRHSAKLVCGCNHTSCMQLQPHVVHAAAITNRHSEALQQAAPASLDATYAKCPMRVNKASQITCVSKSFKVEHVAGDLAVFHNQMLRLSTRAELPKKLLPDQLQESVAQQHHSLCLPSLPQSA